MKIEKQDLENSLIMWSALDYKYRRVYVVAYGLQVTQHETLDKANKDYKECKEHSIKCNRSV